MAVPLTLKTAIGTYPHTRPLKDGTVSSPRLRRDHVLQQSAYGMLLHITPRTLTAEELFSAT